MAAHRDMSITVRADVVDGVQAPDVTNQIWPALKPVRDKLAPGYRLEIGGAVEESQKGNSSIFALFPLMAAAMLTLLMIQLRSFSRLLLVFLTAPLGIIGASLALNLSGKPFGFVALLGPSVRALIEAAGATLLYLPPYSPDFNPIENAFAKLKALLRKAAERIIGGLWAAIGRLIDTFTPSECANYFTAAGYDVT